MNILCTPLYEEQLKVILEEFISQDEAATKKFKLYLDTILINMPTKAHKYKQSIYFENEDIKDIPHEDYVITFFIDKKNNNYLIISINKRD